MSKTNDKPPVMPTHPGGRATAAQVRDYADKLEAYEKASAEHEARSVMLAEVRNKARRERIDERMEELGLMPGSPKSTLLWSMAYGWGHSSGESEVLMYAEGLVGLLEV